MFKERDHLYILCPMTLDGENKELTPERVVEKIILPKYDTISVYKILNTVINKEKYDQALAEIVSNLHDGGYSVEMLNREDYLIKIYKGDGDENFIITHIRVIQIMEINPRLTV